MARFLPFPGLTVVLKAVINKLMMTAKRTIIAIKIICS